MDQRSSIKFLLLGILAAFLLVPSMAQAEVFQNSYVSFKKPKGWKCYLESTAWICRYRVAKRCEGAKLKTKACRKERIRSKEGIIILTAKEVGPSDSIPLYTKHMKTPRPIVTSKGVRTKSKIIHVKNNVQINGQRWVDAMHLGSEIPQYYTRYLASIKGNVAVIVTFSAHKRYYTKYQSKFFEAINSLRMKVSDIRAIQPKEVSQNPTLGPNMPNDFVEDGSMDDIPEDEDSSTWWLLLAAVGLALVGIVVWLMGRR